MIAPLSSDPAKHFGFPECSTCFKKPCTLLRSGSLSSGNYIFVLRRYYAYTDCVFAVRSFREVESYLKSAGFFTLKSLYDSVTYGLRESEHLMYNQNYFFSTFSGLNGCIEHLKMLWNRGVIAAIGIPAGYENNPKIKQWLDRRTDWGKMPGEVMKPIDDLSAPAITDEMADEKKEDIAITNPQWEHKDEDLKQNSPDAAFAGNTIKLIVDIQGYVPQGKVTFDIYDVSKSTPQRLYSVYGKNIDGIASAEWVLEDPRRETDTHELKLVFEASARSKYSERKEIGFAQKISIRLNIDPNKTDSENDTFWLFSTDSAKTYEQIKTIKDDMKPGDACVDLVFTGLDEKLSYTLEIDEGPEGKKYYLFEKVSFSKRSEGNNG